MLEKLLDRFRERGPSRPRSKAETEKRRRFLIVLLIVLAVVSAVFLVGYGYYDSKVRPWNQRILKVNGTVFDMRDFVKTLRLNNATSADYAQYVISIMQDNAISRQRLREDFGVVISDEAAEVKLRELMGLTDNATEEEYREGYKNLVTNLKTVGLSVKDVKELYLKPSLVSDELQRLIGDREYPGGGSCEHAQVQALLITGADDAAQLRARWEAGEAFDTLISEEAVSSHQRDFAADNATMVEWVAKGIKSAAFDDFVFSAALGMLSDPVQDTDSMGSYWLIKVVARESRALSESDRDTLVGEAYSKWLEEVSDPEKNDIVNYLDKKGGTAKLNWALAHVAV